MKTGHLIAIAGIAIAVLIVLQITTTGLRAFDGIPSGGSHGTP
jgi:hypothetical protein